MVYTVVVTGQEPVGISHCINNEVTVQEATQFPRSLGVMITPGLDSQPHGALSGDADGKLIHLQTSSMETHLYSPRPALCSVFVFDRQVFYVYFDYYSYFRR